MAANANAATARFVADRIVRLHLATMDRLNVGIRPAELGRRHPAARLLDHGLRCAEGRRRRVVPGRGPAGRLLGHADRRRRRRDADNDAEARSKVIVRSDGTVTYVGKDIAYQLWKFGLLGKEFQYLSARQPALRAPAVDYPAGRAGRSRRGPAGAPVRATRKRSTTSSTRASPISSNCSNSRWRRSAIRRKRSAPFISRTRLVALSHATARALGYDTSAESDRPFVEVSGRRGQGVKADDLLDRVVAAARAPRCTRAMRSCRTKPRIGRPPMIATAAVRYFMVKYTRTKVIAFDIDEALSFEGESGPYLQYAGRARRKHPGQAAGPRRHRRSGDHRRPSTNCPPKRSRRRAERTSGRSCSTRRGSTRSSSRRCARWSCRCWRNTPSGWRRHSTRSITGIRSWRKNGATSGCGRAADRRPRAPPVDPRAGADGMRGAGPHVARMSHQPSAAVADPLAVAGRTPSRRFDVVTTTPTASFSPCDPPHRRLDDLATNAGEKCGLAPLAPAAPIRR